MIDQTHISLNAPAATATPEPEVRGGVPIWVANFFIATCICLATLLVMFAGEPKVLHWFIIPVFLCGVLVIVDAVDWLSDSVDRFDVRGLIGLLGYHFFFLSPLLHVRWNYAMMELNTPPDDWRELLGQMAILNCIGLVLYRIFMGQREMPPRPRAGWTWAVSETRLYLLLAVALPAVAALQISIYASFGGIVGYIEAGDPNLRNGLPGMGMLFMFSETFPILALMGFAIFARSRPRLQSWPILLTVLAVFFILAMFFGGLRGNRSNTVWNLFWAAGIVHFVVRPMPTKLIFGGLAFLTLFMYAYGLFKSAGVDVVDALESAEAHDAMVAKTRRPIESTILDDFGRADVQAFILSRLTDPASDYEYAWGSTYFVSFAILVPRGVWDRPPNLGKLGTEAQYGMGTYEPDVAESSRVYGLAGEAMLNFGPISVPFGFLLWGLLVRYVRRLPTRWQEGDGRLLLYPLLIIFALAVSFQDSENQLFFLIKYGAVPFIVTWLSTSYRWVEHEVGGEA